MSEMLNNEIKNTKQYRKDLDIILQKMKTLENCQEKDIAIIRIKEGIMWLGMNLKRLNPNNSPYKESYNPENTIINKTADNLNL